VAYRRNLAGILLDTGADPQGLVGGEGWDVGRGVPLPPGDRSGDTVPRKMNFSLELSCFGEF